MKKGLKNYLYQTAYQLLIVLTPLLTAPCLARALGTEGIGIYSYTANFANYFLMFAMLGMANYGARYICCDFSGLHSTFSIPRYVCKKIHRFNREFYYKHTVCAYWFSYVFADKKYIFWKWDNDSNCTRNYWRVCIFSRFYSICFHL